MNHRVFKCKGLFNINRRFQSLCCVADYFKNKSIICCSDKTGIPLAPPLVLKRSMCTVKEGEGQFYFKSKVQLLKEKSENGEVNYPHKFNVGLSTADFISQFKHLEKGEVQSNNVSVAGRVWYTRSSSKKLYFIDIIDDGIKLQIVANFKNYGDRNSFIKDLENVSQGDIIGVEGVPKRTKAGELSVLASSLRVLTPCLRLLPSVLDKVKNQQTKYRQRYLDLLFNDDSRNKFIMRTKIISFIRKYLENLNFLEVETPMLGSNVGGANAEPFQTRYNALELDLFLRIAPELYLKTLIVGGFNRVFEIGKLFRNEGEDQTHSPEFTACEFYMAYADYYDLMKITEDLVSKLVHSLFGSYIIEIKIGEEVRKINFEPPFKVLNYLSSLEKELNITLPPAPELCSEKSQDMLYGLCQQNGLNVTPATTVSKLLDKLFSQFVESNCIDPTFVVNHPVIMSPLAKGHRSIPGLSERFEMIINKKEICNAYTELNDPLEQRERFRQQSKDKAEGDREAQSNDENFCKALEYGLPPTAGWGMGIDRLVMILTNSQNIKDVILFPTLRPKL